VAVRFRVIDVDGEIAVEGRPGESMALPAGDYVIEWAQGRRTPATVVSGETARVRLE
jgi:hypothetical protein